MSDKEQYICICCVIHVIVVICICVVNDIELRANRPPSIIWRNIRYIHVIHWIINHGIILNDVKRPCSLIVSFGLPCTLTVTCYVFHCLWHYHQHSAIQIQTYRGDREASRWQGQMECRSEAGNREEKSKMPCFLQSIQLIAYSITEIHHQYHGPDGFHWQGYNQDTGWWYCRHRRFRTVCHYGQRSRTHNRWQAVHPSPSRN